MSEAWVDHDYVPAPRQYEQCDTCESDRTFQHHCDLNRRLIAAEHALARIYSEANWATRRQLSAHRKAMEHIRGIIESMGIGEWNGK